MAPLPSQGLALFTTYEGTARRCGHLGCQQSSSSFWAAEEQKLVSERGSPAHLLPFWRPGHAVGCPTSREETKGQIN